MRILCLAAFVILHAHAVCGARSIDYNLDTQSSPLPYYYLDTPQPSQTSYDVDVPTSLDDMPSQATISQDDITSMCALLDEYAWLVQPQTVHVPASQGHVDLSSICAFLDAYPWLAQRGQAPRSRASRSTTSTTHICKVCGHDCRSRRNLRRHVLNKHEITAVVNCDMCLKTFASRDSLNRHCRDAHQTKKEGVDMYECIHCRDVFTNHLSLYHHKNRVHTSSGLLEQHNCPVCGMVCKNRTGLANHTNTMHSANAMAPDNPRFARHNTLAKKYVCVECRLPYSTDDHLKRHVKKMHRRPLPTAVST